MNDATGLSSLPIQEQQLITAAAQGAEADFRTHPDGQRLRIRAGTLRDLCTGANPRWKVQDSIRVTSALVEGQLDLSGAHLAHEIRFRDCVFKDPVDLRQASAERPLEWEGGQTAVILADRLKSDADLTIQGVEVTGTISLHWADVRGDLRFTGSHLVQPDGRVIDGSDLRVSGTLFLDGGFHAEGEVLLSAAHIEGDLDCRHASFSNPSGHSITADHLVLGGEFLCGDGFHAEGEVDLQWAQVQRLRATGGTFASATTYALHADALRALAGVHLDRGFQATATVRLVGANIGGELNCTQGTFGNADGRALDAERIMAEDVYLDYGFTAHGEVRFANSQVSRQFNATSGKFHNDRAGEFALNLDGLKCGGEVYLNYRFHANGTVRLVGAAIGGELNCTGGHFTTPGGFALFADGLTTPGMVYLDRGFRADGEVRLARATVRQLVCTGGVFDNQHGVAIDLTGLKSDGDVLLNGTGLPRVLAIEVADLMGGGDVLPNGGDVLPNGLEGEGTGFRATGEVRMRNAVIAGDLDFMRAQLLGGQGVDAQGIHVGGRLTWMMDRPPEGMVDFSFAQIDRLDDTAGSWPEGRYRLTGVTFRPTEYALTVEQRIDWLSSTDDYVAGAYEQVAQAYRLSSGDRAARRIAIAGQRDLRKRGGLTSASRAWNWFLDVTVGYGYRLQRPFLVLAALTLISWGLYYFGARAGLIYSAQARHVAVAPECPVGYPCFNPSAYSLQLLIPVIDMREAGYWFPNATIKPWGTLLAAYTWMMIIIGWGVVLALIPGVSRYFRGTGQS